MALITWTDKLALNLPEIDRQHQKLVSMINDLDAAMQQGRGKDAIGKIIDGLVAYTQFHFTAEEKLMEQQKYPGLAAHRAEHMAFVRQVLEFRAKYEKNQIGLSIGVMSFLSDWLRGHIQGTDRQYVPALQQVGAR